MAEIFNDKFYMNMSKSIVRYSENYENIQERVRILESADEEQNIKTEQNYEILQKFGAM